MDLLPDRGDSIFLGADGRPYCPKNLFFWCGQDGGLEGLRQKGWTLVNLLIILRESKIRNTKVTVLAQGDNQVITTHYRLQYNLTHPGLDAALGQLYSNNQAIMNAVLSRTKKLGLTSNREETMMGSEYLNNGKVPLIRGQMYPLETKRWARTTCITNDQLPSFGNILSSLSTNALTVCQSSNSIVDPLITMYFSPYLTVPYLCFTILFFKARYCHGHPLHLMRILTASS